MSADDKAAGQRPLRARLGWFILLWCAGVATVAAIGYLIKWALPG